VISRLSHLFDALVRFLSVLAWFLVIFLTVAISYEVVLRYFFSRSLTWVTPYAEFSLVYLTFLGAPLLLKRNEHVNLEFIVSLLAPRTQILLTVLTSILGALVCLTIATSGTYISWDLYRRHVVFTEEMEFPQWIVVVVVPLATLLLAIEFLRIAFRNFQRLQTAPESEDD
jgi:C4-dicarboxylate transporter DctQ subunit